MNTTSIIQHHPGTRFIKLREDYLALCEGNHCQALLLDILEEWTNTKLRKQQPPAIYMTYPQWIRALHGLYGRNVVIKSLAALEQRGLISRHPHTLYGKETFSYQLQVSVINQLLQRLAEPTAERNSDEEKHASSPVTCKNGTHPKEDGSCPGASPKRTAATSQRGCNVYPFSENPFSIDPAEKAAACISEPLHEGIASPAAAAPLSQLFPCIVLTIEEVNLVCSLRKGGYVGDGVNGSPSLHTGAFPSPITDTIGDKQYNNGDTNQVCTSSASPHLHSTQTHLVDGPSAEREDPPPAEAVVRLIEKLRGRPYSRAERPRELKAAVTLLNLKEAPDLSLQEIQEAWEHGSDDWWREHYGDDVHVHDLIRRNKRGICWVLAFLDHKRKEQRTPSGAMEAPFVPVHEILSSPPGATSEAYEFLASEAEAESLVSQIERDGQASGYTISAQVEEDVYHPGIWYVQVEWWVDDEKRKTHRVSSWQAWERYRQQQQRILQYYAVPA